MDPFQPSGDTNKCGVTCIFEGFTNDAQVSPCSPWQVAIQAMIHTLSHSLHENCVKTRIERQQRFTWHAPCWNEKVVCAHKDAPIHLPATTFRVWCLTVHKAAAQAIVKVPLITVKQPWHIFQQEISRSAEPQNTKNFFKQLSWTPREGCFMMHVAHVDSFRS